MFLPPLTKHNLYFGLRNTKYKDIIIGNKEALTVLRDKIDESLTTNTIVLHNMKTSWTIGYKGIVCLDDSIIESLIKEVNDKESLEKQERTITKLMGFILPVMIAFSIGVGIYTIFNWIF